jgi:hypothetical protein
LLFLDNWEVPSDFSCVLWEALHPQKLDDLFSNNGRKTGAEMAMNTGTLTKGFSHPIAPLLSMPELL